MASSFASFFLSSRSSVVQLELLEISHPLFSKVYRIVRNAREGVDVVLEDGRTEHFRYYPLRISPLGSRDTLDYGIKVDLGDLGDEIPHQLDNLARGYVVLTPTEIAEQAALDAEQAILIASFAKLSETVNTNLPT